MSKFFNILKRRKQRIEIMEKATNEKKVILDKRYYSDNNDDRDEIQTSTLDCNVIIYE